MSYARFLTDKQPVIGADGIAQSARDDIELFDFQRILVNWSLRRGRSAIFADTGLGKMRMELAWADTVRDVAGDVLILTPLAVAQQLCTEAEHIGIAVNLVRSADDVRPGINVCNYDRLHLLDAERFAGIALDESSCIKHSSTRTFTNLVQTFKHTPYRLAATATPAPNDWTELGTHAEFLGVCSQLEMLSEFFVHDGGETQKWRLKGHARLEFWKWVSQWGALVRRPSDLGFDDTKYILPPLTLHEHVVVTTKSGDALFDFEAQTLSERRAARRDSIEDRVAACVERVNADNEPWIVWCELNAESDALTAGIRGAIEVCGSQTVDEKETALNAFLHGRARVLVTKPSIAGFGLNFQHCAHMAFVGVTDSWESYYQAVRRCWRFGQTRPVEAHLFASDREGAVVANLKRKETDALAMADALSGETREAVKLSVRSTQRQTNPYIADTAITLPGWITA